MVVLYVTSRCDSLPLLTNYVSELTMDTPSYLELAFVCCDENGIPKICEFGLTQVSTDIPICGITEYGKLTARVLVGQQTNPMKVKISCIVDNVKYESGEFTMNSLNSLLAGDTVELTAEGGEGGGETPTT